MTTAWWFSPRAATSLKGVGGQECLLPATGALERGPGLQHIPMVVTTARAAESGWPAQLVDGCSTLFNGPTAALKVSKAHALLKLDTDIMR